MRITPSNRLTKHTSEYLNRCGLFVVHRDIIKELIDTKASAKVIKGVLAFAEGHYVNRYIEGDKVGKEYCFETLRIQKRYQETVYEYWLKNVVPLCTKYEDIKHKNVRFKRQWYHQYLKATSGKLNRIDLTLYLYLSERYSNRKATNRAIMEQTFIDKFFKPNLTRQEIYYARKNLFTAFDKLKASKLLIRSFSFKNRKYKWTFI